MEIMSDNRQSYTDQRYVFFTTFSLYRRRRLLDLDQPNRIVLGVLNHQLDAFNAKCVGFVLMPDHVHVLFWLPDPALLTRFLHGLKRMSSFRIRNWYRDNAPNYFEQFGEGDRLWQSKSYTFNVYSEAKLTEKLNYIHLNPVRASLVDRAEDWRWSSARWYLNKKSAGVPIHWIECQ